MRIVLLGTSSAVPTLTRGLSATALVREGVARVLAKEPIVVPKGDPKELAARLRAEHARQTVLLVGHSDTLPGLLNALGHPADIKIEAQDYGNIFVVVPKGDAPPTFMRLRY